MTTFEQALVSDRSQLVAKAIRSLPPDGQKAVQVALADPDAQADVVRLLLNQNAPLALTQQAEKDLALEISGKEPKVFKKMAKTLAPMVRRGVAAIADAFPHKDTDAGRTAMDIVMYSTDPDKDLTEYFLAVATDAAAPGSYEEEKALSGVGLAGFGNIFKKVGKVAKKVVKTYGQVLKRVIPVAAGVVASVYGGPQAGSAVSGLASSALSGFKGGVSGGIAQTFGSVSGSAAGGGSITGGGGGLPGISSLLPTGGGGGTTSAGTGSQVASIASSLISAFTKSKQAAPAATAAKILPQAPAAQKITIQESAPIPAAIAAPVTTVATVATKAPAAGIPTWAWVVGGGAVALAAVIMLSDDSGGKRRK